MFGKKNPRCITTTGFCIYYYFTSPNLDQWDLRPSLAATQSGKAHKPRSVPLGASERYSERSGTALRRSHRFEGNRQPHGRSMGSLRNA